MWMQFLTEKEVEEVLRNATRTEDPSPFIVLERWMEYLGHPPRPCWIKVKGMPLHAWHEEVFRLRGGCFGKTLEVDKKTIRKEHLVEGRVIVMLDNTTPLPSSVSIWVEEVRFSVQVEKEEDENPKPEGYRVVMRGRRKNKVLLPRWWSMGKEGGDGGGRWKVMTSSHKI